MTSASYQTYAHARAIAITITAVIKLNSAQVLACGYGSFRCCGHLDGHRRIMTRP